MKKQWTAEARAAFLRRNAGRFYEVAFFLTLGGAEAEKAFREMETLAGRAAKATLAVRDKEVKADEFGSALTSFTAALRERKAA